MKWLLRLLLVVVALPLAGWLYLSGHGNQPTTPAMSKVSVATLRDPALIARGKYLTTLGDCTACHTAQGGPPFAGGRSLATPFGSIPAPNITPNCDTGLGHWSFEDFWQALHAGKGRHGKLLYPAFSYTWYTKVTRDDALAIFAYLQSLSPVHALRRPNRWGWSFLTACAAASPPGVRCISRRACSSPTRRSRRSGIGVPTWRRASGIATNAMRHAPRSAARRRVST